MRAFINYWGKECLHLLAIGAVIVIVGVGINKCTAKERKCEESCGIAKSKIIGNECFCANGEGWGLCK